MTKWQTCKELLEKLIKSNYDIYCSAIHDADYRKIIDLDSSEGFALKECYHDDQEKFASLSKRILNVYALTEDKERDYNRLKQFVFNNWGMHFAPATTIYSVADYGRKFIPPTANQLILSSSNIGLINEG